MSHQRTTKLTDAHRVTWLSLEWEGGPKKKSLIRGLLNIYRHERCCGAGSRHAACTMPAPPPRVALEEAITKAMRRARPPSNTNTYTNTSRLVLHHLVPCQRAEGPAERVDLKWKKL